MELYNVSVHRKHFAKEVLAYITIPNVNVIANGEEEAKKLAAAKFKESLHWEEDYSLVAECECEDVSKGFVSEVIY